MASYTNIKDILKQFELQIVQQKHYTKSDTYSKSEVDSAIGTAIAGVNQFNVVKSTGASNTPQGVVVPTMGAGTDSETPGWTGSLTVANADTHTIYFVPSSNGLRDEYDEYMVINGAWEKIGDTGVDLSGYVPTSRTVNGHALSANVTVSKSDVGLGSVTNVATESTITSGSSKNITSGAVYTALNTSVSSSSAGVALGGKVNAPTITVTPGSVASGNTSVVTGGAVYTYAQPKDADLTAIAALTGTSGLLKKTAENTWSLDTNTYATQTWVENKGYISSMQLEALDTFLNASTTTGILKRTNGAPANQQFAWDTNTYLTTSSASSTYTAKTTAYSSSHLGVAIGGTSAAPSITVTTAAVGSGNTSVTSGGQVYSYISGSSGVLYISDSDFTTMLSEV
jgi:hypothetical protein